MATARCENPFFHRGPIRDPAYFFGRERETRLLLGLIRNAQSVSVLGQRRIGKSSFALHVGHPTVLQAHGLDADRYCMVYLDCQVGGGLTEAEFCSLLLQGLQKELATRVRENERVYHGRADLQALENLISRSTWAGYRPVYILDEFEALAANQYVTPDFFSGFRRLATQYPVVIVTVTKDALTKFTFAHLGNLSSTFFNILHTLSLGLYSAGDATEMLQGLAGKSDIRFSEMTLDLIVDVAGGHPLLLQVAGFHAFELLDCQPGDLSKDDCRLVRERFWQTAVQHFEHYWSRLDEESRYVLATLPSIRDTADSGVLERLARECLIVQREPGHDYFCSTFRDFVQLQLLASPPGPARQLYESIRKSPERLLVEIGAIVSTRDAAPQILNELQVLFTRIPSESGPARVAQGYGRILAEPERWREGLPTLLEGLKASEGVEGRAEGLAICELLVSATDACSVASIAGLRPQIEAVAAIPNASLPGLSDLGEVLAQWARIAGNLEHCQKPNTTVEERLGLLRQATIDLAHLHDAIKIEGAYPQPECSVLTAITGDWLECAIQAASAQGQATQLHERIQKSPERLLAEIGDLVTHLENAPDILLELQVLCGRERTQATDGIVEVVQGYTLLFDGRGQWKAGLERLASGLSVLTGVEGQAETLAVCSLLGAASSASSAARIAALRSQAEAAQETASTAIPGFPDLSSVLVQWAKIIDNVENYQQTASSEEKVRYLGNALAGLYQADREIRGTLGEPVRSMLDEVMARWLDTVSNELDELRGRAFLQVSMPTQRVLDLDNVVVVLALRNEGSVEAKNVKVELLPSEQYEILAGDGCVVDGIPAAQSRSIEFHVRPLAEKNFRAEFRISYDDQRRTGRSIPFSDQVALVQVTEGYQPVPNPYHAGRPLPTGSPLFFGREDVFAFIAGNVGGPSLDNVLVLIGQRRSGKTSLLKQLPNRLEKRYVPVYIDGQQLGIDPGMANLFYGLSQVIASSLLAAGVEIVAPTREEFEPAPSQVFEREFLARAEAALGDRRLLLAFDEFEELEARVRDGHVDRAVCPFLRHLMQHSNKVAFMFVGTHRLDELTKDYWSVFFNIAHHREIRFLDEEDASRLIREPVAAHGLVYDDLAVKRILDITAGHPYFVQLMCLALVDFANDNKRNFITVEDVRKVIVQTIALSEGHFRWLWDLSAANERLVMAALTALLRDLPMATTSAISSELAAQGVPIDPAEVSDILGRLAAQDIVEEIPDHTLQYRFKLEIVRLWIHRNKPFIRVIEDVTVREPRRAAEPVTDDAGS